MYILDADCLISPHRSYLHFDLIPQYWEWLIHLAEQKIIGITSSVFKEVENNEDELKEWLKENKDVFYIDDSELFNSDAMVRVLNVYGKNSPEKKLSEIDLEKISIKADPYIIAFALLSKYTVVTNEKLSKGQRVGINRRIPDVCHDLEIECINDHDFIKKFKFSTYLRGNN